MLPGFQLKLVCPSGVGLLSWYLALNPKLARWSLEGVAGLDEITTPGSIEPPPVTFPTCDTGIAEMPLENSEVSLTAPPAALVAVQVAVAKIWLSAGTPENVAEKFALPN